MKILQFNPLKVVAAHQVVKTVVGDEGTVVQLQHGEVLTGAGGHTELSDGLVRDELAVGEREGLQARTVGGELCDGEVRDEDTLLEVHPLQLVAGPGQGNEAGVGEEGEAGTLQGHQLGTVGGQADEALVSQLAAGGDAEIADVGTSL